MVEVNIDIPTKVYTLHRAGCQQKPAGVPQYKGFGALKRDGGWFSFPTEADARAHYDVEWQPRRFTWVDCSYCRE
jgi:hypothetical protein